MESDALERLVDRLVAHRTLGTAPREQLVWLARRGTLRQLEAGATLMRQDQPIEHLWVLLTGRVDIRIHRAEGSRRVMEWSGGDVSGVLPFSRMKSAPGETRALEATEVLALPRDCFPEMIRDCQDLTAILVHVMLDRARHFRSSDLHDEKLASLGRLAAGLAHELNNPASAVASHAAALVERLPKTEASFRALGNVGLSQPELETFLALRERCLLGPIASFRSPLERAERIEAMGDWLEARRIGHTEAEALAETDLEIPDLEAAATALRPEVLVAAIGALAAGCGTRRLASDIERAATRVHELVAAVKGFTYMDQARVPQPVDLERGLADTLMILRSKAKTKSVRLEARVEPGLPKIVGLGGELNQVWSNLIDNAIDAVAGGGEVEVSAVRQGENVVVRVVDNGPGIPKELTERVFEPFFTTKPVGQGTGLGLVIVRSLVLQHQGEIDVDSRPGRTEFRVTLPLTPRAAEPNRT